MENTLFGLEGKAAVLYWNLLSSLSLLPHDFECREGRGANSITNKALNYGYAILASFYYQPLITLGLKCTPDFPRRQTRKAITCLRPDGRVQSMGC